MKHGVGSSVLGEQDDGGDGDEARLPQQRQKKMACKNHLVINRLVREVVRKRGLPGKPGPFGHYSS